MTWAQRVVDAWDDPTRNWSMEMDAARNLNRKLVSYLCGAFRWDIFWTQTFRQRSSEQGASTLFLRCLAEFNSHSTVRAVVYAVEPHASFQSHHVHALLSMKRPLCWTNWRNVYRPWKEWAWRTMGKALILPCRKHTPVWYVVKYVTKTDSRTSWMARMHRQKTPENLWGVLTADGEDGTLH